MYLKLSILPTFEITILQKTIGYQIQCSVFGNSFHPKFNIWFKFNYSKYNPRGLSSGGAYFQGGSCTVYTVGNIIGILWYITWEGVSIENHGLKGNISQKFKSYGITMPILQVLLPIQSPNFQYLNLIIGLSKVSIAILVGVQLWLKLQQMYGKLFNFQTL